MVSYSSQTLSQDLYGQMMGHSQTVQKAQLAGALSRDSNSSSNLHSVKVMPAISMEVA